MPTNTKDTTQSIPSLDNKAGTISEVLRQYIELGDYVNTSEYLDGDREVIEAKQVMESDIANVLATIEKLLLEVINVEAGYIGHHGDNLKSKQIKALKAVLYGEKNE